MRLLYDRDKLLDLMKNFHTITKIKTVVFDYELKVIAAFPYEECAFCAALDRIPETRKKCRESTVEGSRLCKNRKGLNIYQCHAGLIEAVTPIRIGDVIVGYMMLGQVLTKADKEERAEKIIDYASDFIGKDAAMYFFDLVCKSDEEIKAAAKIMESCVCDLLMHDAIKEGQGKIAFEVTKYIEENLSGDLSVRALCEAFKISRNTLYRIADVYLGMPLARYVRKKRIGKAAQLITDGLPVTKVAERLGFCDYGYFGKVFKAVTGKSPTEMKKAR